VALQAYLRLGPYRRRRKRRREKKERQEIRQCLGMILSGTLKMTRMNGPIAT
jgi:hypothetical protein